MKKRGQLLYKFGMEILVAAIVVLTFLGISYKYGSGEAIAKLRIARDIGLMIGGMYSVPDEINTLITYSEDTSKFDIIIKDNIVRVSSEVNDITEGSYNFVNSLYHPPLDVIINKPKKFYIGKINGNIVISDKKQDLRKIKCQENKEKLEIKKILVDSGFDENSNLEKAKIANSIAFSLIYKLNKEYQIEHARNEDINSLIDNPLSLVKSKLNEKIDKADAIIGIQIGEKQDISNNIKIYFSPNSAKKEEISALGCDILNNLIENEALSEVTGIAIVPEDTELILNNDKISMIIEIGNYLNKDSVDMLKNINTIEAISSTIYNTIK